jgi:hypothetical protein
MAKISIEDLTEKLAAWIEAEIRRMAKEPGDVGALTRAYLRLRSVGAPADEIEAVARPIHAAIEAAIPREFKEVDIELPEPKRTPERAKLRVVKGTNK